MYTTWKIERQAFTGGGSGFGWTGPTTEVTAFKDPLARVNLGDARDSFSFKLVNVDGDFSNYFQPNDKITVSRVVNSTTTASSDIIMVGTIVDVPETESSNASDIRVEGYNFSETILSGIVFFDPTGQTIPVAIQNCLNAIGAYNNNFRVTWKSTNPTTTSTGAAFPTVNEKWFNKSIKAFIEKYSADGATGDGNYYWYVNKDNELVWDRRNNNTGGRTFNSATGVYKSLSIRKDLKDVRNWIIIKGGILPNGNPVQNRVQDIASIAKHGLKPHIIVSIAKNAEMLVKQDKVKAGNVNSMSDASFPFVPTWTTDSYASYNDYLEGLELYVREQCRLEGIAYLSRNKFGKLNLEIVTSPGEYPWGLGDLVACTVPSLGSGAKNLRIKDIQYSVGADTFTLEEDTPSI